MSRRSGPALAVLSIVLSVANLARAEDPIGVNFADKDPAKRFAPKAARDEVAEDRLTAAACYAHARLLQLRDDRAGALRRYQRAWRYDPATVSLVKEIVPLANSLRRPAEAARYAVLAAEQLSEDPNLFVRLGVYCAEQDEIPRALEMFERSLELRQDDKPDATVVSLQFDLGRLYLNQGDAKKSAEHYAAVREALAKPEDFQLDEADLKQLLDQPEVLYASMGEAFLLAGRLDEATATFEKANDTKSSPGLLAYRLARVAVARKDHGLARNKLDEYFSAKLDAARLQPYELLATILREEHQNEEAADAALLASLRELHERDPNNVSLRYYLAEKLFKADELDTASTHYSELLEQAPTAVAYERCCDIGHQRKDVDALLAALGKTVENTGSLQSLGKAGNELAADLEIVVQLIEAAKKRLAEAPESISQATQLAVVLLAISGGEFENAESLFTSALTAEGISKSDVCEMVGLALFLKDETARAARVFRQAVADEAVEDKAPFYYYLSGALEISGQTEQALEAAAEAAKHRPDSPRFESRAAWVLYHAKQYIDAERRYKDVLRRYDDSYDSRAIRDEMRDVRFVLSNLCVLQKRMPEAEEWLEQVLDEFPEDGGALNDLGYLWANQGKHLNRALAMTTQAVAGEPENSAYRDSLGWAFYRLGNYDDAIRELEKAVASDDPDGEILDHLGDAYFKAGRADEGIATWKRALQAFTAANKGENVEAIAAKIEKQLIE